jgi:hypothetical protein
MKKILLAENSDKAEAFINELKTKYFPAISIVVHKANILGINVPGKEFLFDLINGNFKQLEEEFWKVVEEDVASFKSVSVREQMKQDASSRIENVVKSIPGLFSQLVEDGYGRYLNDTFFQQFVELNNECRPYISDNAKESISELFRKYLTSSKDVKVYEKHQEVAKALQFFLDALEDAKMLSHNGFVVFPWGYIGSHFNLVEEDGRFKITPKDLNYNIEIETTHNVGSGTHKEIPREARTTFINKG